MFFVFFGLPRNTNSFRWHDDAALLPGWPSFVWIYSIEMFPDLIGLTVCFGGVFMLQSNLVLFHGLNVVGISCPSMTETIISWDLKGSIAISIHHWVCSILWAGFGSVFAMILRNVVTKIVAIIWIFNTGRSRQYYHHSTPLGHVYIDRTSDWNG